MRMIPTIKQMILSMGIRKVGEDMERPENPSRLQKTIGRVKVETE